MHKKKLGYTHMQKQKPKILNTRQAKLKKVQKRQTQGNARTNIYNNEKNGAPIDSFVKMWYNKKKQIENSFWRIDYGI